MRRGIAVGIGIACNGRIYRELHQYPFGGVPLQIRVSDAAEQRSPPKIAVINTGAQKLHRGKLQRANRGHWPAGRLCGTWSLQNSSS